MVSFKPEDLLGVVERDAAWRWICRIYLPDGIKCPSCRAVVTGIRAVKSFEAGAEKTYCAGCSRSFRSRSITPLVGTEWEPEQFVKLLLLMHFPTGYMPIGEMARLLGKSRRCVSDMLDRVRLLHAVPSPVDENQPLASTPLQG